MFREMRRSKQQVSDEECIKILKEEKRGVLSVAGDDGYPYGVPINYYYDEDSGKIYFHCAEAGHKADSIRKNEKVCFTVWNKGFQKEGEWAWNITSVVVFGKASFLQDEDRKKTIIRNFGLKYYPSAECVEEEIRKAFSRVQIVAIEIDHITGKLVNES